MDKRGDHRPDRFSLVVGGPFHELLGRLGLTGDDRLPTRRAAFLLALIAWLPLALLTSVEALRGNEASWGFFSDSTVYTRYLVAIWAMIATERYAEGRIALLIEHFREARLLGDEAMPGFAEALDLADRRSASALAEGVMLVGAFVWSSLVERYVVEISVTSWEGTMIGGDVVLSWAGEATCLVSNPFFIFLVLRWIWRFLVWTTLLLRISRLPLQLTALHPDRSAGLGFLSIYPSIFSGFLFALSCVIASSFVKELAVEQESADTVWFALAGWLGISLVLFVGPLLVFVRPLYAVRERALMEYGRLASHHHLAFHRKWIGAESRSEDLVGSTDPSSLSDLNASVQTVQELRLVPVDRAAVLQLAVAAGVPMLAVLVAQFPLRELVGWIVGAIF